MRLAIGASLCLVLGCRTPQALAPDSGGVPPPQDASAAAADETEPAADPPPQEEPARERTPASVPQIAKATVKGALDKEQIRDVVRARIEDVRLCYNEGLLRTPDLAGRVTVQFTIAPQGNVPVAVVSGNDTGDAVVGQCVATAVKRWTFPEPRGGGNVVVTYPFVLAPG